MRLQTAVRIALVATAFALGAPGLSGAEAATPARVTVTGEIVDTWCYVTEIMMVLRVEDDDTSVANPTIVKIQTHKVTVDGDLYERDGVNYLIVTKVADDQGIVNLTHEDYGIQPFGE
jgi:hypothetical protein